jgi:uncharacterized membrane protein (DUF106 family)
MRKMDSKGQGAGQLLLIMLLLFVFMFVFASPGIRNFIAESLNTGLAPIIGFGGQNPLMTILLAGVIVVFLSSLLTHLFTDWKAMGKAQEVQKAFQKEMTKARKEGNTNRMQKLMKMQPEIMKMSTQASGGMMKSMLFLFIFIAPIFIWLTYYLSLVTYAYFTTPWATHVSLFGHTLIISNWFFLYLIFSFLAGSLFRQGLKWISWSDWWMKRKSPKTA